MEPETETRKQDIEETEPGRLERLAMEVRGLVEDVRTWIDLKIRLIEIEVEERVRDVLNRVVVTVAIGILAFLTLVFVLVTSALALGTWWDSMLLGFLAVTLLLVVFTTLVYVLRPGLVRKRSAGRSDEPRTIEAAKEAPRLEAAPEEETHG